MVRAAEIATTCRSRQRKQQAAQRRKRSAGSAAQAAQRRQRSAGSMHDKCARGMQATSGFQPPHAHQPPLTQSSLRVFEASCGARAPAGQHAVRRQNAGVWIEVAVLRHGNVAGVARWRCWPGRGGLLQSGAHGPRILCRRGSRCKASAAVASAMVASAMVASAMVASAVVAAWQARLLQASHECASELRISTAVLVVPRQGAARRSSGGEARRVASAPGLLLARGSWASAQALGMLPLRP